MVPFHQSKVPVFSAHQQLAKISSYNIGGQNKVYQNAGFLRPVQKSRNDVLFANLFWQWTHATSSNSYIRNSKKHYTLDSNQELQFLSNHLS